MINPFSCTPSAFNCIEFPVIYDVEIGPLSQKNVPPVLFPLSGLPSFVLLSGGPGVSRSFSYKVQASTPPVPHPPPHLPTSVLHR